MVSVTSGDVAPGVMATMPSCSYTFTAGTVVPEHACATANLAPELMTRLAAGTACLGSQPSATSRGTRLLPLTTPAALMAPMVGRAPAWILSPYRVAVAGMDRQCVLEGKRGSIRFSPGRRRI